MSKHITREDDFLKRRIHLEKLSDEDLKARFWQLADEATKPLVDLAYKNTSPAIERSVLLRMGFSSIEANALVDKVINHNLIGKGAGGVVYRLAKIQGITVREAGLKLLNDQDWQVVLESYGVK